EKIDLAPSFFVFPLITMHNLLSHDAYSRMILGLGVHAWLSACIGLESTYNVACTGAATWMG
ncbi:hypothetical protein RA267_29500, partial [Pseudomonas syringae pv. tagetis]|uniref:hypothetical protein n=1 Tax=Pseudomonas syringae group genomosp. 7 TaxID=251699 RepID=UPI00376FA766